MDTNRSQAQGSSGKGKVKYMSWTNEMDRCLSKILVEEARKGNKIDRTLKPAAYTAALTAVNNKFGLELTKDHIRSRLKTWKKQYVGLKEILNHNGFEWDETRKMVIADDSVWNDYIKDHPDAKLFRARLIENYDELCIIIGNDQATVSCSGVGAEVDGTLMADNENADIADTPDVQMHDFKEQGKHLRWSDEMDRCLGKILVDQVKKGNKIDNMLKREAYMAVVTALNECFEIKVTKDHVRNRLKTWKKQCGILKDLLAQNGFKWDATQKMIIAADAVWNDYIKTHPDARLFRARVIENFDELFTIFGSDHLVESYSRIGEEDEVQLAADEDLDTDSDAFQMQSGNNKDQLKNIIWTKKMDSCLGEILVEQAKLGNKINGELGKPVAYVEAVRSLNLRFQLDLTKDHIRNRLKTWKKQYVALKELLDHGGFEWDEKRKMVVANDSVWNDYIKTQPDAKTFRGRVIENYDELCVIFGSDYAGESSPRDSTDVILCLTANNEIVDTTDTSLIRSPSAKEQAKYTRWTNEMDLCLAKILIEQAKLGNKVDSVSKSAVYTAAVKTVNEKFCLGLEKEHIRNRLKTWKKQYMILKELLAESGFEWDKTQKMIIANDSVWSNYIQAHPDARLICGRVIENFDELCIIFGNDSATPTSSRTGSEVDLALTAENDGAETADASQTLSDNAKEKEKYMIWTEEMDRCLTKTLVEQVKRRNKSDTNWNCAAYTASVTALNRKFGLGLTKENIRSRLKTWRKHYGVLKGLLTKSGFEWDNTWKMVIANDSVWNDYIKTHPDARPFQSQFVENYHELCFILGNDDANGNWFGAKVNENLMNCNDDRIETRDRLMLIDGNGSDDTGDGMEASSQQTGARPSSSSHSKQPVKKKRSASDVMVETMRAMAANIGRIADALGESSKTVNLDELFELVQRIPGFDDDLIIEACEYLSFDDRKAKMFFKLDERLRKMWLLKRLRGHS